MPNIIIDNQFIFSLVTAIFVAGAGAYLGTLMLGKRMSLVAGPLGHLTLPGIALALVYGFDVSLGAIPFLLLGIVLIWLFEMRTKLPLEALTAIVFASGVAVTFLFLPVHEVEEALVGDISKIGLWGTVIAILISAMVVIVTNKIFPKIALMTVSEDLAKTEGVNIKIYQFLYLILIGLIVALGVKLVGGLLTAALVAIPASTARNLSKDLSQYAFYSVAVGVISAIVGIFLFKIYGLPAGPMIILASAVLFLVSLIFKRG